ncbi:MAG: GNAT family N-acetyltransferase [Anaerolineae bacterium]|nr:GNAT family N-acetyltransferase [Anaerolineae bacterium]
MINRLFSFVRKFWREVQWRSPVWAQRSIVALLSVAREYIILLFRPYLTIYQLKGHGKGGPLTVNFAVNGADTDLKLYLADILFVEKPVEAKVGNIPFWRLKRLTDTSSSDLTFIGASKQLVRRLPARNSIILPRIVKQTLDVQGRWEDVLQRFPKTIRKNELRLVRKYGYEYEVSNQDEDFEIFFHEMYLPSMRTRHGNQAALTPFANAYRRFKQGILFLVKREGTYVAGGLCYAKREPGVVHFLLTGVIQGDQKLLREGAQSAVYYAVTHWSNKHGYKVVDFQGTVPYLEKGILQHKRKWGAAASIQSRKRIWLKIHRNTPAVGQFLQDNPCIFINERGDLQGLFFKNSSGNISPEMRAKWDQLCDMPGLEGYAVYSIKKSPPLLQCEHVFGAEYSSSSLGEGQRQ